MSRVRRVALLVLAVSGGTIGLWAQAFPRSFYDDFPGPGRMWVALDGAYNEHLVRDVGGLNLALTLIAVVALATRSDPLARAVGAGALVYGVPHLLYHATHLDPFGTGDAIAMVVGLTVAALAGLLALAGSGPSAAATRSGRSGSTR